VTARPRAAASALLVSALLLVVGGCELGTDDEMAPPTRTVTPSPSASTVAVPATVPVGKGPVTLRDVVWAQGSRLHVGRRSVDLSPANVDAFVTVPGGVYVLARGELWFTDLARLRGTAITGVTGLGVTADGARILVTVGSAGAGSAYAFDTATGRAVSAAGTHPVTPAERLRGPDRQGVPVPSGFELAGWAGPDTFYGTAGQGSTSAVISCSLSARACSRLGQVDAAQPVVFGTGR
jgi:hypothetical protein